jgi:hypothetical protein
MYSLHSSLVEHQLPVRGGGACVQAQAKPIYLNLGFLHYKMKIGACTWYLVTDLVGHLELAGHLEK